MLKDSFVGRIPRGFVDRGSDDLVAEAGAASADIFQEGCVVEGGGELVGGLVRHSDAGIRDATLSLWSWVFIAFKQQ
jgi:hypothetical protein